MISFPENIFIISHSQKRRERWLSSPLICVFLVALFLAPSPSPVASAEEAPAGEPDLEQRCAQLDHQQGPFYAATSWASIHRDSRNSDYAPYAVTTQLEHDWHALEGAAVLLAPVIGPGGQIYVTTGQGPGKSHLHAFNRNGELLWQSSVQKDLDDLDSFAVASAPLVDRAGNLYIGDANQVWSFTADGQIRWVTELPEEGGPFVSMIFTREGQVGGITIYGKLVLLDRASGAIAMPVFALPAGDPVPKKRSLPGLWQAGLIDEAIIQVIESAVLGYDFLSVNTPAVHPTTGRIIVSAAGARDSEEYRGVLYGLDIVDGQIQVGFATTMGGGSGTSPTLSSDGNIIYIADGNGQLNAFSSQDGSLIWTANQIETLSSPTVGPNGILYTSAEDHYQQIALNALDGTLIWSQDYRELARTVLEPLIDLDKLPNGVETVARFDTVKTLTARRLWSVVSVGVGYETQQGTLLYLPRAAILAAVDPDTGELIDWLPLPESSDAVISVSEDGRLYTAHAAIFSSIYFYGINQMLPEWLQIDHEPIGGFSAVRPISNLAQIQEGFDWISEVQRRARSRISLTPGADISTDISNALIQICATAMLLDDAHSAGEIKAHTTRSVHNQLSASFEAFTLTQNAVGTGDEETVENALDSAAAHLQNARNTLTTNPDPPLYLPLVSRQR